MPDINYINSQQQKLDARLKRINEISRLAGSSKLADRKRAQQILKTFGYNGPLDGKIGKGTTTAITNIRNDVNADKQRLASERNAYNAAQARKDAARARKEARKNDDAKFNKALTQLGYTGVSIVSSIGFVAYEVGKMDKLDKPVVSAKNRELGRFAKQIDAVKNSKGARNKNGTLKAATKRRIGAIAQSAHASGVTSFKKPRGVGPGLLLAGKGLLLQYAASQTENQYIKDGLNATASGMYLAGLGVPLKRAVFKGPSLNGTHLAKIADAEALAKSVGNTRAGRAATNVSNAVKSTRAVKVSNLAKRKIGRMAAVKTAAKFAGPVGVAATVGFAAHAAYQNFQRTGSYVKAAEAGANSATFGLYGILKRRLGYESKPNKVSANTKAKPTIVKTAPIPVAKSVRQGLKNTSWKAITTPNKTIKPIKTSSISKSAGQVKGHYRQLKSGRVWVSPHRRKAA